MISSGVPLAQPRTPRQRHRHRHRLHQRKCTQTHGHARACPVNGGRPHRNTYLQAETDAPVRWLSCGHIEHNLPVSRLREVDELVQGMIDGAAPYQPVRMFTGEWDEHTGERRYQFSGSWFCAVVREGEHLNGTPTL